MDSHSEKQDSALVRALLIGAAIALGIVYAADSRAHCRSIVVEQIVADIKSDLAEWRKLIGNETGGAR